jgi:hypothetical protein
VVEQPDVQEFACGGQLPGHFLVLFARFRVAGRVDMADDYGVRVPGDCCPEGLAGVDDAGVYRPYGDYLPGYDLALGVQAEDRKGRSQCLKSRISW